MTDAEHEQIEACRRVYRSAAQKFEERGAHPADIIIASIYSAHDLATMVTGGAAPGIEHLRTALDIMERQLLDAAA